MAIIGDPDLVSPDAAQAAILRLRAELARSHAGQALFYQEARKALGDDPDLTVSEMATNMRRHLDDAARFIAGLNLQDHPRATVQAQRAMVMKLNDVLRPQCSKNDAKAQETESALSRALAGGATYSNAAPKMPTAPVTLEDVKRSVARVVGTKASGGIQDYFAPGQRSPIDFKIDLGGSAIRKKDAP